MTHKQILKDEKTLRDLKELFGDERGAQNTIAMYGEDGADIEFVAQRLAEEFPWAVDLINEVVR